MEVALHHVGGGAAHVGEAFHLGDDALLDAVFGQLVGVGAEILVVGDRLYTDILVGVNAGVDSLCVLSGESSLEDVKKYEHQPTYLLGSIKELPSLLEK